MFDIPPDMFSRAVEADVRFSVVISFLAPRRFRAGNI